MENGTTHQKYLQDKHPEVKTVAYDSYQNAIIDLKNGRIDGVFGDTAVVNEWLKTNPQLGAATPKVTDPQYFGTGLGIAVRPDNKALLEKLNAALKAIKADGTYQKISNQWFPGNFFAGWRCVYRPPLFPVGRVRRNRHPAISQSGTKNLNRAPLTDSTSLISPPCSSSIRFTISSPNPPRSSRDARVDNADGRWNRSSRSGVDARSVVCHFDLKLLILLPDRQTDLPADGEYAASRYRAGWSPPSQSSTHRR